MVKDIVTIGFAVDGICGSLAPGPITVGFMVGDCVIGDLGDAHTGWITTSRIIIEELNIQT